MYEHAKNSYLFETYYYLEKAKSYGLSRTPEVVAERNLRRNSQLRNTFNDIWELRKQCQHHPVSDSEDPELDIILKDLKVTQQKWKEYLEWRKSK